MAYHVDSVKTKQGWDFINHHTGELLGMGEHANKRFELFDCRTEMMLPFDAASLAWKFLNDRKMDDYGF